MINVVINIKHLIRKEANEKLLKRMKENLVKRGKENTVFPLPDPEICDPDKVHQIYLDIMIL